MPIEHPTDQQGFGARLRIGITTLREGGPCVEGLALIDTGASRSVILEDVARQCNLPMRQKSATMTTADGHQVPTNIYVGRLWFMDQPDRSFRLQFASSEKMSDNKIIALIGNDLLRQVVFTYDGRCRRFVLDIGSG